MRITYTKELLEPVIKRSINWAQVCREIGVKALTGSQTHVKKRAKDFDIDFSHFLGSGSNLGKKFPSKHNVGFYLKNNSSGKSHYLKLRLFKDGIKEKKCEKCKLSVWMGEEMVLELDHKNENHFDNRLNNLEVLCPNCHAQKTRKARLAKKNTH
jgi:hypothetical protein